MRKVILAVLILTVSSCTARNVQEGGKKHEFLSLLGDLPSREGVNVEVVEVHEFDNHTRKTLRYTIMGETIEAYLLLPVKTTGKVPGILAIHQDGSHRPYEFGKGEPAGVHGDPELQYGLELCLRGYAVICPDRFGFESRMMSKSEYRETFDGFPVTLRYGGQDYDLTEDLYKGAKASYYLSVGKTALGVQLKEMMFAVDYLCSLPEVDDNRIGVLGHSAGGLLASMVMYIDDRIKVGCSSCGTFLIESIYNSKYLRPMNGFCGLLAVPGIQKWGDTDDILAGLYPRPFFETSADVSKEDVHRKALKFYTDKGNGDRIKHIFYDVNMHIFRKDMREKSYNWFDTWFKS